MEEFGCNVKGRAEELIEKLEYLGVLPKENSHGDSFKRRPNPNKQLNHARPTQWFHEAEANGLLSGNSERAKRLKRLAKKDRRKLNNVTESRIIVREQLGDLWKKGIVGLVQVGKPRGVKREFKIEEANLSCG
jgi:hypothetical protein